MRDILKYLKPHISMHELDYDGTRAGRGAERSPFDACRSALVPIWDLILLVWRLHIRSVKKIRDMWLCLISKMIVGSFIFGLVTE